MKIAILDDWFDTLKSLSTLRPLAGLHGTSLVIGLLQFEPPRRSNALDLSR
jgi:hypothetical protein